MKWLAILLLVACGPSKPTPNGASKPKPRAAPVRSADIAVAVTGFDVVMNGTKISGKPYVRDFIEVFGDPDRVWDQGGANKIHTWDKLGLIVYEPYDGRCISATFPYKPMDGTFTPKTLFNGAIVVDGNKFTKQLNITAIKRFPGATTPYSANSVVFDKEDIHVFTIEAQDPLGTIDLVEISFWQRGQGPVEDGVVEDAGEQTCRAGDARVCTRLALAHQTGHGVEKDPSRSFMFAKLGCAANDAFACRMLGNSFDAGVGTTASKPEAKTAWKRACMLGDPVGCERAR